MFGFITNKLLLLAVGAFAMVLGAFYFYYKNTQAALQVMAANVAKAEVAIDLQKQALTQLQTIAEEQKISMQMMQGRLNQAEADRAKLAKAIKDLNIVASAQTNRTQLQTNLNSQLNDLFNSAVEGTKDAKPAPKQ